LILSLRRSYRVHACINRLQKILPGTGGRDTLSTALDSKFPYKSAKQEKISAYVTELIRVLDYAPDLLDCVFHICIRKALELDVEIRIHDGGNATVEKAEKSVEEENGIFSFEEDSNPNQTANDENNLAEGDQNILREKQAADAMADKLDAIMVQVFQHLEKRCTTPAKIMEMYGVAHRTFSTVVLTTYKSKFVQFVLFYLCGRFHEVTSVEVLDKYDIDPLDRHFASTLLEIILDGRQAVILRQISACYLASFVSRAIFIDDQTVCETLAAFLQWTELYISQLPTSSFRRSLSSTNTSDKVATHDDGRNHAVFYTVCQAAFYIMCFRGQDAWTHYQGVVNRQVMDEDDEEYEDLHTMDIGAHRWKSILCSPRSQHLKPLQFCLESVRREFLRLAGSLSLLPETFLAQQSKEAATKRDIRTAKWQKNTATPLRRRRKATSIMTPALMQHSKTSNTSGGVGGMGEGSNPLDSFFPFDPYLLRRSHVFIEKYYRSWQGNEENEDDVDEKSKLHEEGEIVSDKEDDSSVPDSDDDDDDDDDNNSEKENDEVDWEENQTEAGIECGATPMSLASTDGGSALMSSHQTNMMEDSAGGVPPRKSSIASDGSW
jgi:RNA polymerase I-specific transcription initiation factor RRN3